MHRRATHRLQRMGEHSRERKFLGHHPSTTGSGKQSTRRLVMW
jgi:hypothetical protein